MWISVEVDRVDIVIMKDMLDEVDLVDNVDKGGHY